MTTPAVIALWCVASVALVVAWNVWKALVQHRVLSDVVARAAFAATCLVVAGSLMATREPDDGVLVIYLFIVVGLVYGVRAVWSAAADRERRIELSREHLNPLYRTSPNRRKVDR